MTPVQEQDRVKREDTASNVHLTHVLGALTRSLSREPSVTLYGAKAFIILLAYLDHIRSMI